VQHDAEALTEQWHAAQDDVTARRSEVTALRAAIDPARAAAETARGEEEHYREQVDTVALSTFESGRLDAFNALLASETPQDYLDQMSALEMIAADHALALDKLTSVVDRTRHAQDDADAAAARAQVAADEAARAEQELAARKRDADKRIDEAEALLRRLTPRALQDYLGPDVEGPALPSGTGAGVRALRAAAGQLGKAYRWGAEGPRNFDCSGLTSFSFRQAGITLPRSSSQQARVGRPVAFGDLQPGDLVFFHNPVSHVGIYAGGGKMIHAPQTGDVVRYSSVNRGSFSGARRL
jgi:cell wall-associated NlpC family hydrolase